MLGKDFIELIGSCRKPETRAPLTISAFSISTLIFNPDREIAPGKHNEKELESVLLKYPLCLKI